MKVAEYVVSAAQETESSMYVAHNAGGEVLSKRFLQKYLYYAKHRPWQPTLTPEAESFIAEQYSQWRVDKVSMFHVCLTSMSRFLKKCSLK